MEIWKESVSMSGYMVSNMGNVRNSRGKKNVMPTGNGNGYFIVGKKIGKHKKNYYVHRLVAEVFCENQNGYDCVNHKDFNTENNRADNLEWCTQKHNVNYSLDAGRGWPIERKREWCDKIRALAAEVHEKPVVVEKNEYKKHFRSLTEAATWLGVSITSVSRAAKGQTNLQSGHIIKYA